MPALIVTCAECGADYEVTRRDLDLGAGWMDCPSCAPAPPDPGDDPPVDGPAAAGLSGCSDDAA